MGITEAHESAVISVRNYFFPSPFAASKYHPLVLLLCSHSWECADDGEHILKVTPILHVANRDSHATSCLSGDLCRSYLMLLLEIKLSHRNMQSQNLLRLFIPVLSLTPENVFFSRSRIFPVKTYFCCCLSSAVETLRTSYSLFWSLLKRTAIMLLSVMIALA